MDRWTNIKVAGQRAYRYRAINLHSLSEKIAIDKRGAKTAAIRSVNEDACVDIQLGQLKYLNDIVEQEHRAVK